MQSNKKVRLVERCFSKKKHAGFTRTLKLIHLNETIAIMNFFCSRWQRTKIRVKGGGPLEDPPPVFFCECIYFHSNDPKI